MWRAKRDNAVLKVVQQGAVVDDSQGKYQWKLHWQLYSASKTLLDERNITLLEPFTPNEYDHIATYLDKSLDDVHFDQDEADEISTTIDTYRERLFKRLQLNAHLVALQGQCLEIHIWPSKRPGNCPRSIHSIEWEQLEDLGLWSQGSRNGVSSVTVCRHVHYRGRKSQPETSANAWRQYQNETFNVLLVVARSDIHESPEELKGEVDVLNPATIRSVLLQLQEELVSSGSCQRIRLEIVRPGCFEELKKHLERRKVEAFGTKPYNVIHFDLHGGIAEDGKAFLRFNAYEERTNKLKTNDVPADEIAKVLRKNKISCAILNACQSAVAHEGSRANLSSIFVRNRISAVLAMSHKMHDSISKRFYSKFYERLFVHHDTIWAAATRARQELFKDRTRWSYAQEAKVRMQDWFIPVVYTLSEEPYCFIRRRPSLCATLFGNMLVEKFVSSTLVSILIYYLLSGRISRSIAKRAIYCPNPSVLLSTSQTVILSAMPLFLTLARMFQGLRWYWRIRQRLRVLAEDRQNVLRIEGDLRKKTMVFFHSEDHVEEQARPFIDNLAAIWESTHFLTYRGAIDAEWFVQPGDLAVQDGWRLWVKACTNRLCLWVYSLRKRNFSSTREANSVIIIENLDTLYPEAEVLRETQYYASAQRRLENWLLQNFGASNNRGSPYLMFTALRGKALGDSVSKWLKDGPGRCGVLDSTAMTVFVETSERYIDPTNASFDKDKWYDWSMSWFCGDVSRPPKKGLVSALCDLPSRLVEDFI